MARAFKCDRCGDFEQGDPRKQFVEVDRDEMYSKDLSRDDFIELCTICVEEWKQWFGSEEITEWENNDTI